MVPRNIKFATFAAVLILAPVTAMAGPQTSEVQFDFSENGVTTAYSAAYAPNTDIAFTEVYGGYTVLISASTDNAYGPSPAGTDPFLSFTIQISPVGNTPPPSLTIGMSMTGLTSSPNAAYDVDSAGTAIFHTRSTAAFNTSYDASNTLFGTAGPLSSFLLTRAASGEEQSLLTPIGSEYSLSIFFTLNPVGNAHPTLDGQLDVTPVAEPPSLALLGAACLGLAGTRRRKKRSL